MTAKTEYIVRTAAANMPNCCWGRYGRVAVMEVEHGVTPSAISSRARGVVRVIETWEKRHVGLTSRCAFDLAKAEAVKLATKLNGGVAPRVSGRW